MEEYRDILTHTISIITKTYLVYAAVLTLVLVLGLIIKSKKIRNAMLGLLMCTLITYAILVVPRLYDLHNNSFVKVKNATIMFDEMYTVKTDMLFFGHANIVHYDGKTISVSGTDFLEFPAYDLYQKYYGDIVYAKYSHQLIAMEWKTE